MKISDINQIYKHFCRMPDWDPNKQYGAHALCGTVIVKDFLLSHDIDCFNDALVYEYLNRLTIFHTMEYPFIKSGRILAVFDAGKKLISQDVAINKRNNVFSPTIPIRTQYTQNALSDIYHAYFSNAQVVEIDEHSDVALYTTRPEGSETSNTKVEESVFIHENVIYLPHKLDIEDTFLAALPIVGKSN